MAKRYFCFKYNLNPRYILEKVSYERIAFDTFIVKDMIYEEYVDDHYPGYNHYYKVIHDDGIKYTPNEEVNKIIRSYLYQEYRLLSMTPIQKENICHVYSPLCKKADNVFCLSGDLNIAYKVEHVCNCFN
jgi:hypothetical protein